MGFTGMIIVFSYHLGVSSIYGPVLAMLGAVSYAKSIVEFGRNCRFDPDFHRNIFLFWDSK